MKKMIISLIGFIIIIGAFYIICLNKSDEFKEYGYKTIEEYYTNDNGEKIYTKLYKPDTKKLVPIVIYSHGLGATYRAATDYAEALAKLGVATLSFDFRGGSSRSNSDGLTTQMSIITECDDLEFLIGKVKKFDFVDKNNIILMGSSQGGAVSALVSSKHNDIKGLVLLYPALSLPSVVRNWYSSIDKIPEEVNMSGDSITVGRKYFTDIWDLNVYDVIKDEDKELIIIHGTDDNVVPISQSRVLNDFYKNSRLYEIDGAGHGFEDESFEEANKYVVSYLTNIGVIK